MSYEKPLLQVVTVCADDILRLSFDPFFGEEDMLDQEEEEYPVIEPKLTFPW